MNRLLIAFALSVVSPWALAQNFEISDGQTVNIEMGSLTAASGIFFDAPASTRQLVVTTTGSSADGDVDIYVRSGEPFPAVAQSDLETFKLASQYWSLSPASNETLRISDLGRFSPGGQRWHILVVNLGEETLATLRVQALTTEPGPVPIEVDYQDAGTLLGRTCVSGRWTGAAQQAMQSAVDRIASELNGPVPVRISACWVTPDEEDTFLAAAAPLDVGFKSPGDVPFYPAGSRVVPGVREPNTLYPSATAAQAAGTDFCALFSGDCEQADVAILFSADSPWSFSLGDEPTPGQFDFVTVAMHELTHGLGFAALSVLRVPDAQPGEPPVEFFPLPDAYSNTWLRVRNAANPLQGAEPFWELSESQRVLAVTANFGVVFDFEYISGGVTRVPYVHSPNPFEPGSSLSHFNEATEFDELMVPSVRSNRRRRALGVAAGVLDRAGWSQLTERAELPADPYAGQWFDPTRPGHGIDLVPAGGGRYILTFYSYGEDGSPEWYLATGSILDGRFVGDVNEFFDTLVRYRYDISQYPAQVVSAEDSSSFRGRVEMSFDAAEGSVACGDGVARDDSDGLAAFTWQVDNRSDTWCMLPLLPSTARAGNDITGHWFAGDTDAGWGMSLTNGVIDGETFLFGVLYYGDAQGLPRWAYFVTDSLNNEETVNLVRRQGYCRSCPAEGESPWVDQVVGTLSIRLQQASNSPDAGNRIEFDIDVPGTFTGAGSFSRASNSIQLLSQPIGN